VAGFLGASNLLRGRTEGSDGDLASVRLADGALVRVSTSQLGDRTQVDLGVRPEKIRMLEMTETPPEGANLLTGTVTSALYMGVSTQYQVALRSGTIVVVYEQNLERARAATQWQPGEATQLAWSPRDTFAVDLPATHDATDDEMLGMTTAPPEAA
jgi:spermidine/putrescine transport system ATP-binding protein